MKLLTIGNDAKTVKGEALGYQTAIMYLAPYTLSGHNVCPMAEQAQCHVPCLNTAGRGRFTKVQEARTARTKLFFSNRDGFLNLLRKEIKAFLKKTTKIPCIRLNGTSDIRWENIGIPQEFPDVQFYDYTKLTNRKGLPKNYHLTWSYSSANQNYADRRPDDLNWAVVFSHTLPQHFLGRTVVDGDASDLRFLDPPNSIVGLKAKGKARMDTSGFVVKHR